MGCDFYEIRCLCITFKNSNNEIIDIPNIELEKIPHWLGSFGDSDESDDDKLNEEMKRIMTEYGNKVIYDNGKWMIKSKSRMEFYMDYVNEYKKMIMYYIPLLKIHIVMKDNNSYIWQCIALLI